MLFWIFIVIFIVAIVVYLICDRNYFDTTVSTIISCVSALVIVIMLICIAFEHINIDGRIDAKKQKYETLSYQINNDLYSNDNDIGKRELYEQVRDWNEDLAYAKKAQNDFWIGIFYADIYDEFDYICLPQ